MPEIKRIYSSQFPVSCCLFHNQHSTSKKTYNSQSLKLRGGRCLLDPGTWLLGAPPDSRRRFEWLFDCHRS